MAHAAFEHVGDCLYSPVRMPGETREIILRTIGTESVEKEEGIERFRLPETENPVQSDAGSVPGLRTRKIGSDPSLAHDKLLSGSPPSRGASMNIVPRSQAEGKIQAEGDGRQKERSEEENSPQIGAGQSRRSGFPLQRRPGKDGGGEIRKKMRRKQWIGASGPGFRRSGGRIAPLSEEIIPAQMDEPGYEEIENHEDREKPGEKIAVSEDERTQYPGKSRRREGENRSMEKSRHMHRL
jgi:hypothetical protein